MLIHYPFVFEGDLLDGVERRFPLFSVPVRIVRAWGRVAIAPSGGNAVVRLQDGSGASPASFVELVVPDGETKAEVAGADLELPNDTNLVLRVVSGNGAEFLFSSFEMAVGL